MGHWSRSRAGVGMATVVPARRRRHGSAVVGNANIERI